MSTRFKRDEGAKVIAPYRITCSGCGASEEVRNTRGGNMPHDVVTKKFQQKGWVVGSKPSKDECPACKQRPREMKYTVDKNLRVDVPQRPVLSIVKEAFVPTPETPTSEITREVRRRILGRLDEVYAPDGSGYKPGWSDRKVASVLTVNEAWVADLRQENFGDLPVSAKDEGMKKLLLEIVAVRDEAQRLKDRTKALLEATMTELTNLENKMADLEAQEQLLTEQIEAA